MKTSERAGDRVASADPAGPVGRVLLSHHADLIRASGINDGVRDARGYISATTIDQVAGLGFAPYQCLVPALVLPLRAATGEVVGHQLRPDRPREANGKAVKYETPEGSRLHLDVPPAVRHMIRDARTPLIVTEGIRKADSAATRGVCAIALLGVWGWRGRDPQGRKAPLAEWEDIRVGGREVHIAFDSDLRTKPEVRAAAERLAEFLKDCGAIVRIVCLPDGPNGTKVGLDDFLAAGHGANDLFALPVVPPAERSNVSDFTSHHKTGTREVKLEEWRGSDLMAIDIPPIPESLPILGRGGVVIRAAAHVLSGPPKSGKSTLLVGALSDWLRAGLSILFFTEEGKDQWVRRARKAEGDWSNVVFVPVLGSDKEAMLRRAVEGSEDVVLVDTIRSAFSFNDETDNSEVARKVNPWVHGVSREKKKTLLLVHHSRKGGGNHGEGISGASALLGAVDVAIEIDRDTSNSRNRRVVRTLSRITSPAEFVYEMDTESGVLTLLGDPTQLKADAVSSRVLDAVREGTDWLTTDHIRSRLGSPPPSDEQIRRALNQLARRGEIDRDPAIAVGSAQGKECKWRAVVANEELDFTSNGDAPKGGSEVPRESEARQARVKIAV